MHAEEPAIVACVLAVKDNVATDVARLLGLLGGLEQHVRPGDTVFLKPNFVAPFLDAVTDFRLIAAVVAAVRALGGRPVLGESSGFEFNTSKTLQVLGAYDLAESLQIPLLDLDSEAFKSVPGPWPLGEMRIAQIVYDADVFINLPKLKHHSLTTMTGAMKNLFGVLHRDTRRRMHAWNVNRGITAVNRVLRPRLSLVDAMVTLSRAVYGKTQPLGLLFGGVDPLTVDRFGCRLLGLDEAQVPHVQQAVQARSGAEYQVIGDPVTPPQVDSKPISVGARVHRALIQGAYVADLPYSALKPGHSLLPRLHFELGVKPSIRANLCTECGDCVPVCPVDAIDVPAKRIIADRCECLRCLKCVSVCPEDAIEVRGWRRPS